MKSDPSPIRKCSTCGKNRDRHTRNPRPCRLFDQPVRRSRNTRRRPTRVADARHPPTPWTCETCGKTRYGEQKFAKRSEKELTIARGLILDKLGYEEERSAGLEEKILAAIGSFLRDLWNDPAPWEYEEGENESS